jgi:hypothetical protein
LDFRLLIGVGAAEDSAEPEIDFGSTAGGIDGLMILSISGCTRRKLIAFAISAPSFCKSLI